VVYFTGNHKTLSQDRRNRGQPSPTLTSHPMNNSTVARKVLMVSDKRKVLMQI